MGFSVGINLDKISSYNHIPWFSTDIRRSIGFSPVIYDFEDQCKFLLEIMKQILEMDSPLVTALMNLSSFTSI